MGQLRANPLLKVLQDHRLLVRRLIDSLNLPTKTQAVGLRSSRKHAQAAAHARWADRQTS
jgi:hypothetical protein